APRAKKVVESRFRSRAASCTMHRMADVNKPSEPSGPTTKIKAKPAKAKAQAPAKAAKPAGRTRGGGRSKSGE
ncbi:MAG TPA: hypothetical protein VJS92_11960, partial [Candidatus Polarisedimenticolaceae bacterium]|nr:hypothetical protein [Candidatus Polarisedimenticolaceae bacterium]